MNIFLLILACVVIAYLYFHKSNQTNSNPSSSNGGKNSHEKQERLTDLQSHILSFASFDKSIYGENPSFSGAQMPNGARCFNLRSITTLVNRGLLKSDSKGGFLLTAEGEAALKTGKVTYRDRL